MENPHRVRKRKPEENSPVKRKREPRPLQPDGFIKTIRTTKTKLSSLLNTNNSPTFLPDLENLVVIWNQLSVVASLVIKHYVFTQLDLKAHIRVDHPFLTTVIKELRHTGRASKNRYLGLDQSIDYVERLLDYRFPDTPFMDTIFCQLGSSTATRMLTNIRVLLSCHLESSLQIWLKNQIRSVMSEEEYDDQRTHMKKYLKSPSTTLTKTVVELYERRKVHVQAILELLQSEKLDGEENEEVVLPKEKKTKRQKTQPKPKLTDAEKAAKKTRVDQAYFQALRLMYDLRLESERLETQSDRSFKTISVLPEAHFKLNNILLDTRIMAYWRKKYIEVEKPKRKLNQKGEQKEKQQKCQTEQVKLKNPEYRAEVWSFFFDVTKLRRLRKAWTFQESISTNGIQVSVGFHKSVKKFEKREPPAIGQKPPLTKLAPGLYSEQSILDRYSGWDDNKIRFVANDPGVINLVSTFALGENHSPINVSQKAYKHSLHHRGVMATTSLLRCKLQPSTDDLTIHPFRKTVILSRFEVYLRVIRRHWSHVWRIEQKRQFRHNRFERWKLSQAFMDDTLNQYETQVKGPEEEKKQTILLFGNGGAGHGGFGALKGGGVKGPVKKLKRLLARRFAVITADEFRTTKCCLTCGRGLRHPRGRIALRHQKPDRRGRVRTEKIQNGVTYCCDTTHHSFLNRDPDASRKIGYRFCMRLCGRELGVWSRNYPADKLGQDRNDQVGPEGQCMHRFMLEKFPADSLSSGKAGTATRP